MAQPISPSTTTGCSPAIGGPSGTSAPVGPRPWAGIWFHCPQCRREHYQYPSCQNRHCPKCQHEQAERWLEQQRRLLLPVAYFLATFTLPAGLRRLARGHQKVLYALLFQASPQALQKLAADPKYIGGSLGLLGVLHSWTRDLRYHPQVHALIPGGGLAPDGHTWRPARYNYLLPEKPLAQLFRATFRDLLKKAGLFTQVPSKSWDQDWVVDILAVGNGEAALKYLAPSVFRVAISHRNLLALQDGHVTFQYRHAQTKTTQTATLPAETFIGRFLQHVLPRGFQKVRTYGLLHPTQHPRFAVVKEQVQADSPQRIPPSYDSRAAAHRPAPPAPVRCPRCACAMLHICEIRGRRGPPCCARSPSAHPTILSTRPSRAGPRPIPTPAEPAATPSPWVIPLVPHFPPCTTPLWPPNALPAPREPPLPRQNAPKQIPRPPVGPAQFNPDLQPDLPVRCEVLFVRHH
jgi:putative transposase/transposase-like zinc-binding protein